MSAISWLKPSEYEAFKDKYNEAVEEGKEMFFFNETEFLTSFGKYVIEFIMTQK